MPFQLSPAEEQVRKTAQEYTEKEIISRRKELEKDDRAIWEEQADKQGKAGFHLHIIPREEGGTGIGFVASCIAMEEICAGWPDLLFVELYEMAYYFAKATGGEVEKKFMPGILKGEVRAVPGVTEPSGGSDLLGLQSTAKKVDGGWVLNGRKCFIDEGEICHFAMVLVKTGDPDDPATKGTRSLTAFIVERDMPGYRIGRLEHTLARKEDLAELILDNVFVPDSNVVGGEAGVGHGVGHSAQLRDLRQAPARLQPGALLRRDLAVHQAQVQIAAEQHPAVAAQAGEQGFGQGADRRDRADAQHQAGQEGPEAVQAPAQLAPRQPEREPEPRRAGIAAGIANGHASAAAARATPCSSIRPSTMRRSRRQRVATFGSWVISTKVVPWAACKSNSNSMT